MSIKYLAVRLDSKMTFGLQINNAITKTAETTRSLRRLMANIGGPIPSKRKMLINTNISILLHDSLEKSVGSQTTDPVDVQSLCNRFRSHD